VLCSKCAANLPDGSQFCLKCGQAVDVATYTAPPQTVVASLGCSKCGADLPDEAEFCPKCGKPVSSKGKTAAASSVVEVLPPERPRPRPKPRRAFLWVLFVVVLFGAIVWVISSESPFAQSVQEFVGWKHDQTILDSPFSVGPHTFRYYKFSLPEGSVNVAIVGQFSATAEANNNGNRKGKDAVDKDKDKDKEKDSDGNIEVYVLTEPAFTVWQNGYATSSVYESGKVSIGTVQADIPAGAGIYYLVFSNKSSPKTPKDIHATVLLRYKSWLPEWFRRMKDRFWNWIGM